MINALERVIRLYPLLLLPIMMIACTTKHIDRIEVIQNAFSYNNIDSTISLYFTDDVIFEFGEIRLAGKQALRGSVEWDSVINSRFYFSNFRVSADTVFCKCTGENDISKLQGIEKEYFDPVTFVFKDEKIIYTKWEMTPESQKTNKIAYSTVIEWSSLKQPDILAELMPDGKFIMNATTAKNWLILTREWREDNQ